MISKADIKLIQSLKQKKYRKEHALFVAEGDKIIQDLLPKSTLHCLYKTKNSLLKEHGEDIDDRDMKKISFLKTPTSSFALFKIPLADIDTVKDNELNLVLENIQDPGNLGTIIRIADWYGIKNIICSIGTVDAYNPKVVQATMGSISAVNIHYTELESFFNERSNSKIYGALLNGKNIHKENLIQEGYIVIGNEGNGISEAIIKKVNSALTIPQFGGGESLNAAVATAIICDNFLRQ